MDPIELNDFIFHAQAKVAKMAIDLESARLLGEFQLICVCVSSWIIESPFHWIK